MLANNIKTYRKSKGITQEEMARDIEISRSALSRIETGSYSPSAKTMGKISNYFKVPIGEIFFNPDVLYNNTNSHFE
ncbi:XRE family transcriptional regulator [Sporosarcina sp. BI001-red]|uniref:helix-turn-helix transcriptional regulator n=1 Tax=Sporosarcina sp. BI001-red TaxID=2282866 RepID=UPI000E24E7D4|nr:XRE family transcriptional regulator [Sporosarcina sp. BI001-red]